MSACNMQTCEPFKCYSGNNMIHEGIVSQFGEFTDNIGNQQRGFWSPSDAREKSRQDMKRKIDATYDENSEVAYTMRETDMYNQMLQGYGSDIDAIKDNISEQQKIKEKNKTKYNYIIYGIIAVVFLCLLVV